MGTAYGQGTGANVVVPKGKPTVTNAPILKTENSPSVDVSKDNVIGRNPQSPKNVENAVKYVLPLYVSVSSCRCRVNSTLNCDQPLFILYCKPLFVILVYFSYFS